MSEKNQGKLEIRCAGYYPYSTFQIKKNILLQEEEQTICFLPSLKTFQPFNHEDFKLQNIKKNCYSKYHYV